MKGKMSVGTYAKSRISAKFQALDNAKRYVAESLPLRGWESERWTWLLRERRKLWVSVWLLLKIPPAGKYSGHGYSPEADSSGGESTAEKIRLCSESGYSRKFFYWITYIWCNNEYFCFSCSLWLTQYFQDLHFFRIWCIIILLFVD